MATEKKVFKINGVGKTYSHDSCSKNPGAAKARATKIRKDGTKARVVKSGNLWCVYTRKA